MLKFRCQHCRQRIAVPARHLGKLVTCAECGRQTHPLAQEIVAARDAAAQGAAAPAATEPLPSRPAATPPAACANCGVTVGRLQASHLWEGECVCGGCFHLLTTESSLAPRPEPVRATRVRPPAGAAAASKDAPALGLREQIARSLVVFVVGVVALYGALTLLRDLAGLIAVTAVAALALLALYGIFRAKWAPRAPRPPPEADAALVAVRGD